MGRPRYSFVLKVDHQQEGRTGQLFNLSLLLVKSRRVHGHMEHRVVKMAPQTVVHSEGQALRSFLDLRNRIVDAGVSEFVGGHILGPLSGYAQEHGVPESGMTLSGNERYARHEHAVRKRGTPILD